MGSVSNFPHTVPATATAATIQAADHSTAYTMVSSVTICPITYYLMLGSGTYSGTFLTYADPIVSIANQNVEGTETVFFRAVTNTGTNHDTASLVH